MFAKVLDFSQVKALSVVQFVTSDQNSLEYISGPEAIKQNFIDVEELSESGDVNRLKVVNLSDKFVFLLDGDILKGAKQNRVLNTSVFLKPASKTILPVSCVERGRWRQKTAKFESTDLTIPATMRAAKAKDVKSNLKEMHEFESDQSNVWSRVDEYSAKFSVRSATANFEEIIDTKAKMFEEMVQGLKPSEVCNGMAIFIGNKILNIDVFNRSDIYHEYFPKLLRSAAMDAFNVKPKNEMERPEAEYKTLDFLDKFETLEFEVHKGVAAGKEKRFETEELTGFELIYKDKPVHLAALHLG